jgi:hypothetical protein
MFGILVHFNQVKFHYMCLMLVHDGKQVQICNYTKVQSY